MVRTIPALLLVLLAAGCREGASSPGTKPPPRPGRDSWWSAATLRGSEERILAPRELRALLAEGVAYGFDGDETWWKQRLDWVNARILELDPDDVASNAALGRATLQSLEGFATLWERMLTTRYPDTTITELIDQYDGWVQEGRPVFLGGEEVQLVRARLREAKAHLDRLDSDPKYAALEGGLARVRSSVLADYPFLHVEFGPFVVFYAARDLARIAEADPAAEERRLAERREVYRRRLEAHRAAYEGLLGNLARLFPELVAEFPLSDRDIFYQWVFADREWYADHVAKIRREGQESTYRCGFYEGATGWAYLFEPPEQAAAAAPDAAPPDPALQLRETMIYLAATQILWRWGRDRVDPQINWMERTDAYWLSEGWASFFAAMSVPKSAVGPMLREAKRFRWVFPPLSRVTARRSRLDLQLYDEPVNPDPDAPEETQHLPVRRAFTDLAWLLVSHLQAEPHREAFVRYLRSQLEGTRGGLDWFEECFGLRTQDDWKTLERAVYARVES